MVLTGTPGCRYILASGSVSLVMYSTVSIMNTLIDIIFAHCKLNYSI